SAGRPRGRPDRLHARRPPGGNGSDGANFLRPVRQAHGRVYHRAIRVAGRRLARSATGSTGRPRTVTASARAVLFAAGKLPSGPPVIRVTDYRLVGQRSYSPV